MPEGSADAGSSQRSARRSASSTASRSTAVTAGSPAAASWLRRDLAGQVPVDRAAARRWRAAAAAGPGTAASAAGRSGRAAGRPAARSRTGYQARVNGTRAEPPGHPTAGLSPGTNSGNAALRVGAVRSRAMRRRGVTVLLGAVLTVLLSLGVAGRRRCRTSCSSPGPTVEHARHRTTTRTSSRSPAPRPPHSAGPAAADHRRGAAATSTLLAAIAGWFSDDDAVVPRELIYPPDQTEEQVEQQNAEDFADVADQRRDGRADRARLSGAGHGQRGRPPARPPDGVLQAGDVITTVDGTPVTAGRQLLELIRAKPAGTTLTVGYTRGGKPRHGRRSRPTAGDDGSAADRRRDRAEAAAPVHAEDRPRGHRRPDRRPDVRPRHHRQAQARGPHRRQDHRRHRHDRRRGQRRADRRRPAEAGRRQGRRRDASSSRRRTTAPRPSPTPQPGCRWCKVATLDEALTALETLRAGGSHPAAARGDCTPTPEADAATPGAELSGRPT